MAFLVAARGRVVVSEGLLMAIQNVWIIECDFAACRNQFIGLHVGREKGMCRRSEAKAFKAGWGKMPIGKFGKSIHICPTHREALYTLHADDEMSRTIVDRDFSADHTVKLDCGHEFGKVLEIAPDVVKCPACYREWWESGAVIGTPRIEDLIRDEAY